MKSLEYIFTFFCMTFIIATSAYGDGESSSARKKQTFSLVLEPIGFSVYVVPSYGGALGVYLTSDQLLEVSGVTGKLPVGIIDIDSSLYEARLKSFWGNSFYTNLGFAYRNVKVEFNETLSFGEESLYRADTSTGLSLAIGNRWQWDTFTLGCDWLGYFVHLSRLKDEYPLTDNLNSSDQEVVKKRQEEIEKTALGDSPMFLRIYMGVSF